MSITRFSTVTIHIIYLLKVDPLPFGFGELLDDMEQVLKFEKRFLIIDLLHGDIEELLIDIH